MDHQALKSRLTSPRALTVLPRCPGILAMTKEEGWGVFMQEDSHSVHGGHQASPGVGW